MDPFATARPGAAFDAYVPAARERAARRTPWTPEDGPLPALYVSHGAPPLFPGACSPSGRGCASCAARACSSSVRAS
jgi:hypothetical protein